MESIPRWSITIKTKTLFAALALLLASCASESAPVVQAVDAAAQVATTSSVAVETPTTTVHDDDGDASHTDDDYMTEETAADHLEGDEHATDEHGDDMADMDHATMSVDLADEGAIADRTVDVVMSEFAFDPGPIEVVAGETIEFVIHNEGAIQHEFRVTTQEAIDHHVDEGHSDHTDGMEPGVMLVDPGQSGSMLVTFHAAGEFDMIACLIPAHYEAGMATELNIDG